MFTPLYLDHNATTPLDARVLQVMMESLQTLFGNPSSLHAAGRQSRSALQQARQTLASFLGFRPQELIFCSSGTEGMNMLLRGWFQMHPHGRVITSTAEHACVYETLLALQKEGLEVIFLSPGAHGAVLPSAVEPFLKEGGKKCLLCFMAVNNETGVKTDIAGMAKLALEYQAHFFVDAVAWLGKESGKMPLGVNAVCCSAHKIHGPKGIAAVAIRGWNCPALITGGGQEFGKRAGTEAVPLITGFAKAVTLLEEEMPSAISYMMHLRDDFENALKKQLPGIVQHGAGARICNTVSLSFLGCDGESLLIALDQAGMQVSHGSACASGSLEPSRILREMGVSKEEAGSAIRFSLSRMTTEEEMKRALTLLLQLVPALRRKRL